MRTVSRIAMILVLAVSAFAFGTAGLAQGWSTPLNLSDSSGWYSVNGCMDFDANNKIHLVYEDWSGTTHNLFYMTNMSGGWVRTQLPVEKGVGPYLRITPDQVVHVFTKGKINGESTIIELHKPVSGGSWSSPVNLTPFTSDQWTMGMCVDSNGGMFVCWLLHADPDANSAYSLFGRYLPLGGSWGPVEQIIHGNSSTFPNYAQMVADGSTLYCTYERGGCRYKKKVSGGTWGSEKTIITGSSAGAPRLAFSPTGEMAAAYQQNISPNYFDAWVKFSTDGGTSWTQPYCISDYYYWIDRTPEMCYDSNGDFHIIYQRFDEDGSQPDVWYRSRVAGDWSSIYNLSNDDSRSAAGGMQCIKALGTSVHVLFMDSGWDAQGFEEMIYVTKGTVPPPGNQTPVINACSMSTTNLFADGSTNYTVTLTGFDPNGVTDIDDMRVAFNFPGDANNYRGYLAWGLTQADVSFFGGNWTLNAASGGGYWGFCNDDFGYQYITPVSCSTTVVGAQRSVTFTFKANPGWATDGPLTGNFVGMWIRDAVAPPYGSDWQSSASRFGLSFNIYAAGGSGTISGVVKDRNANPISGATVATSSGGFTTTTNSSGEYTLSNVTSGIYSVTASKTGYTSVTNSDVTVFNGQTTTSNFVLTPSGWASYLDGTALPQNAGPWGLDASDAGTVIDLTGGNYGVRQVDAGSGYDQWYGSQFFTEATLSSRFRVDSYSGTNDIILQMVPDGDTAPFMSVAIQNGRFCLVRSNSNTSVLDLGAVTTGVFNLATLYINSANDTVRFKWNGTEVFNQVVTADLVDFGSDFAEFGASNYWGQGDASTVTFDWLAYGQGYLSVPEDVPGTPTTGTISGTVTASGGGAISGATVATTSGGYTTTTDASGHYTLSGVVVGTYSVVASKTNYNSQTNTGVVVTSGQTTTSSFALTPLPGSISGTVTATGGAAISGATVATTTGGYTTTTNASGQYTLSGVAVGTYSVVASHPNYNSATNSGVVVNANANTVSNFILTPLPGSISGTVTASGGGAISGATVATTTGGYTTTTNASGQYTLSGVAVGTYSVVASATGYNSATNSGVVVNPNANTVSNFTLTAAGNLVTNGNFEAGFSSTGWASTCSGKTSRLPTPIGTWGWNNDTSYPFNTFDETTTKHAGSHALGFSFCQSAASPGKMGIAFCNVNLGGSGISKTFTVWARHADGNCPPIMCWNPGQNQSSPNTAYTAGRYQWVCTDNWGQRNTWVTRSMTVTSDSSGYVTIMMGGAAHTGTGSGAKVYIDDVTVQ